MLCCTFCICPRSQRREEKHSSRHDTHTRGRDRGGETVSSLSDLSCEERECCAALSAFVRVLKGGRRSTHRDTTHTHGGGTEGESQSLLCLTFLVKSENAVLHFLHLSAFSKAGGEALIATRHTHTGEGQRGRDSLFFVGPFL